VLKMRPVMLPRFPYLGVGAQGPLAADRVFQPLDRAKDMGEAVVSLLVPGRSDGTLNNQRNEESL